MPWPHLPHVTRLIALPGALVVAFACSSKTVVESAPDGTTSTGTGGAAGAYSAMSCSELDAEYLKEFQMARICSPDVSALECTLEVDNQLYCPCPRFVNPANASAVAHLNELSAGWEAKSCPPMAPTCDAGTCQAPGSTPASAGCALQPEGSSALGLCDEHS